MNKRGGNLSVFLNADEYERLEKWCDETGLTRSRIVKTALAYFANSQVLKELRKVKARDEEMGKRTYEQIKRGE